MRFLEPGAPLSPAVFSSSFPLLLTSSEALETLSPHFIPSSPTPHPNVWDNCPSPGEAGPRLGQGSAVFWGWRTAGVSGGQQ